MLALIAAVAKNGVIGADGRIPWDIPEDRKHFKELTMGHVLVMGRRTYEEIGRPLPGRITIVVSKTLAAECGGARALKADDCLLYAASLDDALRLAGEVAPGKTVFISGGGQLYKAALSLADVLYLTEIDAEISGDTYFPAAAFARREETRPALADSEELTDGAFGQPAVSALEQPVFVESEVTGSGVSESGLVYRYVTYLRLPWSAV